MRQRLPSLQLYFPSLYLFVVSVGGTSLAKGPWHSAYNGRITHLHVNSGLEELAIAWLLSISSSFSSNSKRKRNRANKSGKETTDHD